MFFDKEYSTPKGASVYQIFLRNCGSDERIYAHPHFLSWLNYFIQGPNLSEFIIEGYEQKLESFGELTSGDRIPLAEFVRQLVRKYTLTKKDAEEIFKLHLEYEDDPFYARQLRTEARKVAG